MTAATQSQIDAVWRIESAQLIAGLTRVVGDVGVAEDLAQDAFVAALEQWPAAGVPDSPGAWLMAVAKRRGVDALRRRVTLERKQELLGRELQVLRQLERPDLAAEVEEIEDDVLRLVFMTCHPVLSRDSRVALTLRLLGGLSTPEIARAFLVSEGTVAQRIVRAKRTLAEARVPFEVPGPEQRGERLAAVLEVIYLVFNEGYAATAGEHWTRPALCEDALRLGRILAALMPREPEVHGLLSLIELQASRLRARVGPGGEPVLLADQDRARWDQLLVQRGLAALSRAEELSGSLGPYTLQAAIAACHARAPSVEAGGVAADRRPLRRARRAHRLAGGRAQPRRRRLDGLRPRAGAGAGRGARRGARPALLPPAAQRSRRPPPPPRPPRRGPRGLPPRRRALRQRARARAAAGAGGGLRGVTACWGRFAGLVPGRSSPTPDVRLSC